MIEKENKFKSMYRLQSNAKTVFSHNVPCKRVLISGVGKIQFNPNEEKYIYFSRTDKHHIYYILNKVLKIIVEEVNKFNHTKGHKILNLPEKLYPHNFYISVNTEVIKRVREFFNDYLPPLSVELVTLNYLNRFSEFFEACASKNKHKHSEGIPEISDTTYFKGAYGINDAWLELLKTCTYSTERTNLQFDKFFEIILESSYRGNNCRKNLKSIVTTNPIFFELLKQQTYTELKNPDFLSKNASNDITRTIEKIQEEGLYSTTSGLTKSDFTKINKQLKLDLEELRLEL